MSAVLRKKIESSSGVPPSVLQMRALWELLTDSIAVWTEETFEDEVRPLIAARSVINGKEALAALEEDVSFVFKSDGAHGLCAVSFDHACVVHYAALRMKEDVSEMADMSQLFLRLICENPASQLWASVAAELLGHAPEIDGAPLMQASEIMKEFEVPSRYLRVGFGLRLGSEDVRVSLMFELEQLQKYANSYNRAAQYQKEISRSRSPGALRKSIRTSQICVNAVLDCLEISIGECSRLAVGNVLPLPNVEADRLALTAETIDGSLDIGYGELGVWKQNRALKLNTPIRESFVRDIADL